jgi:hypothetical protein
VNISPTLLRVPLPANVVLLALVRAESVRPDMQELLRTCHEPISSCYEHVSLPLYYFCSYPAKMKEYNALLVTSSPHSKAESPCTIETRRGNEK